MSTASIRKPLIITSDKEAAIIADILDSASDKADSKSPQVFIKEIKDKFPLSFIKESK